MNRKAEIEARLERSLRHQVQAPRLDGRFDAAVWTRIALEEQKSGSQRAADAPGARPVRVRTPGWLVASNLIGAAVAIVLIIVSISRSMTGVELPMEIALDLPQVSPERQRSVLMITGHVIAAIALGFGLTFTRFGRKVRSALS
jgi:hypothetical protein